MKEFYFSGNTFETERLHFNKRQTGLTLSCAIHSLCKKTPTTSLFLFLNQLFTKSKLLGFKNFESLVFDAFLSKTENP